MWSSVFKSLQIYEVLLQVAKIATFVPLYCRGQHDLGLGNKNYPKVLKGWPPANPNDFAN